MRNSAVIGLMLAIAGASTPFVILAFRHRALRQRVKAHREATDQERERLRRRARASVVGFVAFWIVALGLITLVSILDMPAIVEYLVLVSLVLMVAVALGYHLGTRCPICTYRLGYQHSLTIPSRCERCGASLL